MSAELPSERELFLRAMAMPPEERRGFVERACAGHAPLRQRVWDLLGEAEGIGSFLDAPALGEVPRATGPGGTEVVGQLLEKAGDRIGRYKLLQNIGEGGCGVVYMAEQEEPVRRRVALKIIKPGMDTKSVIARFEAERQALAMMEHPNIAKFLDAGTTGEGGSGGDQSRPYFVMELVRGVRITDYCDQNNLSTESRLELFVQVCQAIHHAHQKGIIHRDIKPSNILVTLHDGRPVPKVIDFGIAKATEQRLTERTLFTQFAVFIGTPAYMSPEQAEMSSLDVDTRSDIYALGVLLYELLIGRPPFDPDTLLRSGLDECRRTIREVEPLRPSTRLSRLVGPELTSTAQHRRVESTRLIHQLRGDLDWVVMKCLEKDRTRRYPSANDLALEVNRYLHHDPVDARPPSNLYRLAKLIRRHRAAMSAAAVVAIVLIVGAATSTWLAVRATRAEHQARAAQAAEVALRQQAETERVRAEREGALARLNEYVADINLAQQSLSASGGNLGRALQLLAKHEPTPGDPDLRGFEWRYLWQQCQGGEHLSLPRQKGPVQSLAIDPRGRWIAVGQITNLTVYDLESRRLLANVPKGARWQTVQPDGRTLITASSSTVRAWDTANWTELRALPNNTGPLSLSADGKRLITFDHDGAVLWNTETWEPIRSWSGAVPPAALAPDGESMVTEASDGSLAVFAVTNAIPDVVLADSTNVYFRVSNLIRTSGRARTDEPSAVAGTPSGPGSGRFPSRPPPGARALSDYTLSYSRDGRFVVAPRNSLSEWGVFVVSLWDVMTGRHMVMPDDPEHIEHTGSITALAFSNDGRRLATASADYSVRIWDFAARQRAIILQGHADEVHAIAFSHDGKLVASGDQDGMVHLWPTQQTRPDDLIPGSWQPLAFSRDSRRLAALNRELKVVLLDLETGQPEQQFSVDPDPSRDRPRFGGPAFALTADLRHFVHTVGRDVLQVVNTQTLETNRLRWPEPTPDLMLLTTDAQTLITSSGRGPGRMREVAVWDLARTNRTVIASDGGRLLLAPDDQSLIVVTRTNLVQVWDLPTRTLRASIPTEFETTGVPAAACSWDSRHLALAGHDDIVRIFDLVSAQLLGVCSGHKQRVHSVAFAPDGKTLASVSDDSTLKLWNVATQQELLTIRRLGGSVRELLFSPDGRMLVGSRGLLSRSGGLRFHRAPGLEEIARAEAARAAKP